MSDILKAFETLTRFFWDNKDKLPAEYIEAWNMVRNEYTRMMGNMIKLLEATK